MKPDSNLISLAKAGDTHAFARLYESVYKDLYRFALYTLHHPQDAEDAVSETVIDAFAQIKNLRSEDAFKSWIFRILSAKCNHKIKEYTAHTEELPEELAQPEEDFSLRPQLQKAFSSLEDVDRLILSMSLFAGYSGPEISSILNMNSNTVRSRQSRALKKMKEMLT